MKKENQRVLLTKRLLQDALLRLLENQSIESVHVKQLCEEAGINRSTFYRYYTIPKDVLLEIEKELFSRAPGPRQFTSREEVRVRLEECFDFLYENADLLRVILRNISADDLETMMDDFVRGLAEMDSCKNIDPEKLTLISSYICGGSVHAIRRWLRDGVTGTPAELADFTMDILFNYLRSFT